MNKEYSDITSFCTLGGLTSNLNIGRPAYCLSFIAEESHDALGIYCINTLQYLLQDNLNHHHKKPSRINISTNFESLPLSRCKSPSNCVNTTFISLLRLIPFQRRFSIMTFLVASAAFAAAAPQPAADAAPAAEVDTRDVFGQLQKRCQSDGQYCDYAAIRCCAGYCCHNRACGKC